MQASAMSGLLLSILGLSVAIPHCPVWQEIRPCTCRMDASKMTSVTCERMESYEQVAALLQNRWAPTDRISLKLASSRLEDLPGKKFRELNVTIEILKLNHDSLEELESSSFEGLHNVLLFSLADNHLGRVPEHLWKGLPSVSTLDLGRTKIKELASTSFKGLPVRSLVLPGNFISRMDTDTFPVDVQRLHIGRNNLHTLNGTLRNLSDLVWLFANSNELTDIEGELPLDAKKLKMIHFSNNKIERMPQQLRTLGNLDSIFFQHNRIKRLDGTLAKCRKLVRVVLEHNHISELTQEDFVENDKLGSLILGNNRITHLNNSLLNLRNLSYLNLSSNLLTEFSFQEIAGLQNLSSIDLSFNRIKILTGAATNQVDHNMNLTELKLDHNEIEKLGGALFGLPQLLRLNLSSNKLTKIAPDDLIGLEQLVLLDVSHNYLTTLEETSKTFLPRLEELKATDNYLTFLERDFHGLPVLCNADLSNNKIVSLGRDLVAKTRCKKGSSVNEGTWDILRINLQDNPILCDAALPEITSAMEINHAQITGTFDNCPPSPEDMPAKTPPPTSSTTSTTANPNATLDHVTESTPAALLPAAISTNITSIEAVRQERQLSMLASEIKELRNRVDELANQNQRLLEHANKTTERPPNGDESRKPRGSIVN